MATKWNKAGAITTASKSADEVQKNDEANSRVNLLRPVEVKRPVVIEPTIDISVLDQQDWIARDSSGRRWVRCEICHKAKPESEFSCYGGQNHINLGICRECNNANSRK